MTDLLDTLPTLHRLALAYASAAVREETLTLLALDARLADVLRSASEPMLAQIRLAWWRDMLGRDVQDRPAGDPLLAALGCWRGEEQPLVSLIDGWEHLADDAPLGQQAMGAFCEGRGAAFAALARLAGCAGASDAAQQAGEGWALADLASRMENPAERESAMRLIQERDWKSIALPRGLRPLAVLHGLAARAGRKGRGIDASGPGALMTAIRIGLSGR